MNKIGYYRISFRLASPLAVGSGENANSDSDIILDSRGRPVIPASAFAGVIRHYLGVECNDKNDFFGYIDNGSSAESRIKFYDAVSLSDTRTDVRDSVQLEDKVSVKAKKFDMEVAETGAEFVTLFELHNASETENESILDALSAFDAGQLRIGSKTSRGYGQIKLTKVSYAEFVLPDQKEDWLSFDPHDLASERFYKDAELKAYGSGFIKLRLELKQCGAVSVRSYTVKSTDISAADYIQLSTSDGCPVIPGTSWAGTFRSRFAELGGKQLADSFFGYVDMDKNTQQKSKIYFSESRITSSTPKVITRNSVDRFSGAVKEGALYTEKTCYNGRCTLDIDIKKDAEDIRRSLGILSAVICDLDKGYL